MSESASLGDPPVGGPRAHLQALLDLRRGLPRLEPLRDREDVADAAGEQPHEAPHGLALRAQREERLRRRGGVASDERVDEAPDLALGGVRGGVLDDVAADPRARAELERELLELAQQPLLALADEADQRLRSVAVELHVELAGFGLQPAGQVLGLQDVLFRDDAAGLLDRLRQQRRDLEPALVAAEERDRRVGRDRLQRGHEVRLDVGLLEAFGAVDDEEAPADRERHRVERAGDRLGARGVALEALDAVAAGLGLGDGAQGGATLADAAVIVAVDEVCGLEGGHGGRVYGGARTVIRPPVTRSRTVPSRSVRRTIGTTSASAFVVAGVGWP